MRTLLHIGINKTGTSAIQVWLATNRTALAARGIAYPDLDTEMHGHHPLARRIARAAGDRAALAAIRGEVEAARQGAPLAVFSSEHFHTLSDLAPVLQVFPQAETRVLLYLREPVAHLVSWYQQAVQSRAIAMTLPEFARLHHRPQSAVLDRWAAAYGAASLRVRVFDRASLAGGDIVADMASAAFPCLDPQGLRTVGERNASITGNLLFLKRLLNLFLMESEAREIATEVGAVAGLSPRWRGRLLVGQDEARRLAALTARDRDALLAQGVPLPPAPTGIEGRPSPEPEWLAEDVRALRNHLRRKRPTSGLAQHLDRIEALLGGWDAAAWPVGGADPGLAGRAAAAPASVGGRPR